MLRDRRLPELERIGDIGHRSLVAGDELEDVATARFRDGVEGIRGRRGAGHAEALYIPIWECVKWGEAAALPPDRLSASAKAPARQAAKATASLAEALRARAEGGSHGSSGRGQGASTTDGTKRSLRLGTCHDSALLPALAGRKFASAVACRAWRSVPLIFTLINSCAVSARSSSTATALESNRPVPTCTTARAWAWPLEVLRRLARWKDVERMLSGLTPSAKTPTRDGLSTPA